MKAICTKSILITKRSWLVTVLRTGTPSLVLLAGLLLDMHGHVTNQPVSIWYSLDKVPQSTVRIVTANGTDDALINIYIHLIPASHIPLLINLDTTNQVTVTAKVLVVEVDVVLACVVWPSFLVILSFHPVLLSSFVTLFCHFV